MNQITPHESQYSRIKREILEAHALEIGKPASELVPFVDYDPPSVDELAFNRSRGRKGVTWAGD